MIDQILYTNKGTTYIFEGGNNIGTDNLTVQQAITLAYDSKSKFTIDRFDRFAVRQSMTAFGKLTNTKPLYDYHIELGMHLLCGTLLENFTWDMSEKIIDLFVDVILTAAAKKEYNITNDDIEKYVRQDIIEDLQAYIDKYDNNLAKKYIQLFKNGTNFNKIKQEVFQDNDCRHQYKDIATKLKTYFISLGYEILDIDVCIQYLKDNLILTDRNHVLQANIEALDIKCPIEFLNVDYIIQQDNDVIPITDKFYLNTYILKGWYGLKELISDNIIQKKI